jgi:6-phosphogluconolactonase
VDVEICADAQAASRRAASVIAAAARSAVAIRGRFVMALSGGHTPKMMFRALGDELVPWTSVHVTQVDERVAPRGAAERNLTQLGDSLLSRVPLPSSQLHAMPVENADVDAAANAYSRTLESLAGSPPVLDLVHLGLGTDGHTASLFPGDPALEVFDRLVAVTGVHSGLRRMTLTYTTLNRARAILWLITGSDKTHAAGRLLSHDPTIPAGRIRTDGALVLIDRAAAARDR